MAKPRRHSSSPPSVRAHTSSPRASASVDVNTARDRGPLAALTAPGPASGVEPGTLAQLSASLGWGGFGGQGYHMADWSASRGLVYFPELNTRREVTPYTRTEGLRKARYLEANVGLARRLLNGMGRFVAGTGLMPNPTTRDKEWNRLARARVEAIWGSAETFDLAGKFNGYNCQAHLVTTRYRDGDCGTAIARDSAGNLRFAFYEGHQIDSATLSGARDLAGVVDGVRVDRMGRRLSFFIRDGEELGKAVELPADVFIHFAKFDRLGATRGVTILKHAINNLLDRAELESFLKHGIKIANKVGYALVKDAAAPAGRISHLNPVSTTSVTDSAGNTRKVKTEEVYSASGGEIPELPPGWDIKMLLDQRPHPNTREFFEDLVRDISLGCDWSPELLWNVAKLGGTGVRFVMADGQSVIEQEQQHLIDHDLARKYVLTLAAEMQAGRLRRCQDPEWWAHEFIPPARITVDYGRDGKLHLEQIKSGALTFRRFFGWQGLGVDQLDHWLDEVALVAEGAEQRWPGDARMRDLVLGCLYQRPGMAAPAAGESADDTASEETPDDEAGDEADDDNPDAEEAAK